MAGAWELEIRDDGTGILWADAPGEKVNLLSSSVVTELDTLVAQVARQGKLKSLVIASRKGGVFFAGADVKEIRTVADSQVAYEMVRRTQLALDEIARLPIPTVAAIEGACLGGGLELALACSHRVISEHPKTELGLPEVTLGIIPGFGGTQRLPRLVGIRESLAMILTGASVRAKKAQRTGLADTCVPEGAAVEEAVALGLRAATEGRPRSGYCAHGIVALALEATHAGQDYLFRKARETVMKSTRGHYPAPLAALDAVRDGLRLPMEKALEIEARHVVPLVVSPLSKNLIRIFFQTEAAKKLPANLAAAEPLPVSRIGVLGAGVMGGGIAQISAARGLSVRLKDVREDLLGKGLAEAARLFKNAVDRGRMRRNEAAAAMARISPALGYEGFSTLDVVIEAVVEKLDVKRTVLSQVEAASRGRALFASNTSSITIAQIAEGAEHPERVAGMHFFNPVEKMPLVEVVRGPRTDDRTLAAIFALARRLGKVPLVCKDGPGFLVNRLLMPYLNESAFLLQEGAGIEALDAALLGFGMPMGPARLLDEVGLDVAFHVAAHLESSLPDRMPGCPLLRRLFEEKLLGKKVGAGFYLYRVGKQGPVNPAVRGLLPEGPPALSAEAIVERAMLPMINEAARILEEGIVDSPGDVDLGMVLGTGFPPFRGGPLRHADSLGLPHIVKRLQDLAAQSGPRFAPSPRLLAMAQSDQRFFPAGG
jgi:3-hydroxyacyl-CoA dehydrogenase / enoyl-CoA hydratase / 3-hydroxybutyryl-CoA epimerase